MENRFSRRWSLAGAAVMALLTGSAHGAEPFSSARSGYLDIGDGNGNADFWYELRDEGDRDWFTRFSEPGREVARSTFLFDREYDGYSLQWGSSDAEFQRLDQAGIRLGGMGLAAFGGEGRTVSDVIHPWQGAGSFHFHGGIDREYDFSGYRLDYAFAGGTAVGLTRATITADGLEDRDGSELSLRAGNSAITLLHLDSGGETAGRAIGFNTTIRGVGVSMQHMAAENDATYSAFGLSRRLDRGRTVALRLEQRVNPLYDDANDNRFVVSLAYRLRGDGLFRAAETEGEGPAGSEDGEEAAKSKSAPVLIGAGVVGGAVALSSGGGGGSDDRPRFNSQNASAKSALNEVNPRSIRQNREWGGYVYRWSDGTYSSTTAVQGTPTSLTLPDPASATPRGSVATASYHTHAAFDPRYDNENFSPQDILSDIIFGLDGYLGTPQGQFKFHDVSEATITTLGGPGTLATQ